MSDAELAIDAPEEPQPPRARATRGGRGGRGGRKGGRGGGRGRITKPKPVAAKKPTGPGRRGRLKQFDDSFVQANYERQRETKAHYTQVAAIVRSALQDLADRTVDKLTEESDYYKQAPGYQELISELGQRRDVVVRHADVLFDEERALADRVAIQETAVRNQFFDNAVDDSTDLYLDGLLNRLETLEFLHDHNLPVDLEDVLFTFEKIDQKTADEQGQYIVTKNGVYLPYPHMVEGTEAHRLLLKGRAQAIANASAPRPRIMLPRPKRRADEAPDGQPATKRQATETESNDVEEMLSMLPAQHSKGLLSAEVAPDDGAANDGAEDVDAVDPTGDGEAEGESGGESSDPQLLPPEERMPLMPKNATEADDYGVRLVLNLKGEKETSNNRIMAPCTHDFDDVEIGFRDSTNDPSRKATRAKRGKFLGTPNTTFFHYDPCLNGYDARLNKETDLDQELVVKHKLHPKYGIFLPESVNESEPPKEPVLPGKPKVFITPSGQTLHASRTMAANRVEEQRVAHPLQENLATLLAQIIRTSDDVNVDDIDVSDDIEALRSRSLHIPAPVFESEQEDAGASEEPKTPEFVPLNASEANAQGLDFLLNATAAITTPERPTFPPPVLAAPRLTPQKAYDAVRDVFTLSSSSPRSEATKSEVTAAMSRLLDAVDADTANRPVMALPIAAAGGVLAPPQPQAVIDASMPSMQDRYDPHMPQPAYPESPTRGRRQSGASLAPVEGLAPPPMFLPPGMNQPAHAPPSAYNAPPPYAPQHNAPPQPVHMYGGTHIAPAPPPVHHQPIMPAPAGHHQPPPAHHQQAPPPPSPQHFAPQGPPAPRGSYPGPEQRSRSPSLPALRPPRPSKQMTSEIPVDPALSPPKQSIMSSNSGAYYLPGPPRPYHSYQMYDSAPPPLQMPQQQSPYMQAPPPPPPPQGHIMHHPQQQPPTLMPHPGPPPMQGYPQQPPHPHQHAGPPPPHSQQPSQYGPPPPPQPQGSPLLGPPTPQQLKPKTPGGPMSPTFENAGSPTTPLTVQMSRSPKAPSAVIVSVAQPPQRHVRRESNTSSGKLRKLEPAPIPPHRAWSMNNGPELRTVAYDYKESIKDYSAEQPPPRNGPQFIRGWNNLNSTKKPRGMGFQKRDSTSGASGGQGASVGGGPTENNKDGVIGGGAGGEDSK